MALRVLTDRHGLSELIHDRYFDLDLLHHDPETKNFRLPFGEKSPYDQATLIVTRVRKIELQNEAYIGVCMMTGVVVSDACIEIVSPMLTKLLLDIEPGCEIHVKYRS